MKRFALLLVAACSADPGATPNSATPAHIVVLSGDAQLADVGDPLAQPIRFLVTDARDRPVGGANVNFMVTAGDGAVPHPSVSTDDSGVVETTWIMGTLGGVQLLEAKVNATAVAIASAATCLPGKCYPASRVEGPLSDATLLTLATYDSSGQTVHPDIVYGHGPVEGFWLAVTPFPGGDLTKENPSIFKGGSAAAWTPPDGVTNPLALPSAVHGYNSDPDIVFNPTDQRLWLFYRTYATQNVISVIRSADGTHWEAPIIVISVPSHQLVSPAIVRGAPQAAWAMWSVNSGAQGCSASQTSVERRTSKDGLNWLTPITTDLVQPGQVIWHIDVQWVPARAEYWAIYNTYPTGGTCSTRSLYLARSSDGTHWTTSVSPIARAGVIEQFADVIYRSTFLVNSKGTSVTLWMSGAKYYDNAAYAWRTATVATSTADLLAIAALPAPVFQSASYRRLPNPEP